VCCDSVAMRAVSSSQQLKSLRDKRLRRPLSHRNGRGGRTGQGYIGILAMRDQRKAVARPGPQVSRAEYCLDKINVVTHALVWLV
jgi:hypothetical protein